MDYLDYREKLGIGFNDEEKVKYFYTVLFNRLDSMCDADISLPISIIDYRKYCDNAGVKGIFNSYNEYSGMRYVVSSIKEATNISFKESLIRIVAFMNCINGSEVSYFKPEEIKEIIAKCFLKAHIDVEFIEDVEGFFIFPQGAKELDDALVSQQLLWLMDYPKTHQKYVQTLRKYSEKSDSYSNIADDFRKTLETFFQEFFSEEKTLENLKSRYGSYLKSKGVAAEISNNLETLLSAYTNYNNRYAKHHDGTNKNILEYLMYQTGIIIRLLITLEKE